MRCCRFREAMLKSALLVIAILASSCDRSTTESAALLDSHEPVGAWRDLETGLSFGEFLAPLRSSAGDSIVRVLRIDPAHFELRLMNASKSIDQHPMTAAEWAHRHDLIAAINPSMYQEDHSRSVSLMLTESHINNSFVSKDRTVLAFDRLDDTVPPVQIIDRNCQDFDEMRQHYGTLIQSIRMVSCDGRNVWTQQPRKWSTAAIGIDRQGRVLFIHVRSPYSTHDLIGILLELPLELYNAMYTEGGPEAQLFVRTGGDDTQFIGSFETGLIESDDNARAWPVPNVVGIVRRNTASEQPAVEVNRADDDHGSENGSRR